MHNFAGMGMIDPAMRNITVSASVQCNNLVVPGACKIRFLALSLRIWYTLSNINIWHTVKDLAERLLRFSPITRGDIEECLEEHGVQYAAESNMDENLQWQPSGSPANI